MALDTGETIEPVEVGLGEEGEELEGLEGVGRERRVRWMLHDEWRHQIYHHGRLLRHDLLHHYGRRRGRVLRHGHLAG